MEKNTNIAPAEDPVIIISDLYKSFGENKVLKGFNLTLKRGKSRVVLGQSGSGKSILIKCIIGLVTPDSGSITVLGQDVLSLDHEEMDKLRAKVGFLFQSNALYDSKTVRENLEFPMRRHSVEITAEESEKRILAALENVGLEHTIDMMPAELSGGMQKRIALARTLILNPEIILYDEPTTGLDPITAREIMQLIRSIQAKYNTSSIIISHDMKCVEETSDSISLLIDGKNYVEGTFEELSASEDPTVKHFFE